MEAQFIPSICKPTPAKADAPEKAPEYTGSFVVKLLSYDERRAILEEEAVARAIELRDAGGADLVGKSLVRSIARQLPDRLLKISITRVSDGFEFTKWEELNYDGDMVHSLTELCHFLVGGFRVGRNS